MYGYQGRTVRAGSAKRAVKVFSAGRWRLFRAGAGAFGGQVVLIVAASASGQFAVVANQQTAHVLKRHGLILTFQQAEFAQGAGYCGLGEAKIGGYFVLCWHKAMIYKAAMGAKSGWKMASRLPERQVGARVPRALHIIRSVPRDAGATTDFHLKWRQ